jgi:hypothetical protein
VKWDTETFSFNVWAIEERSFPDDELAAAALVAWRAAYASIIAQAPRTRELNLATAGSTLMSAQPSVELASNTHGRADVRFCWYIRLRFEGSTTHRLVAHWMRRGYDGVPDALARHGLRVTDWAGRGRKDDSAFVYVDGLHYELVGSGPSGQLVSDHGVFGSDFDDLVFTRNLIDGGTCQCVMCNSVTTPG